MAKLLTQSLVSASGSSSLALNIFQQYMLRVDDEVQDFEIECAEGSVHGKKMKRGDFTELPGFARLTAAGSSLEWTLVCSAMLDRMCYVDGKDLDEMYEKQLNVYRSRQYSRMQTL